MSISSPRSVVTARDRDVLCLVQRFQLLSRDQIRTAADFGSKTRVNARLASLIDARLLDRRYLPARAGHGGAQALYFLGPDSLEFSTLTPQQFKSDRRQVRRWDAAHTAHCLAANSVLINWLAGCRGAQMQPIAYRTEVELRRGLVDASLVPDGWIAWEAAGRQFNAFIEVDLHHEGLTFWRQKVLAYLTYLESGAHAERFGFRACRVLVIATSSRRLAGLQRASSIANRLFLFALLDQLTSASFFSAIWKRVDDGPLIELAAA